MFPLTRRLLVDRERAEEDVQDVFVGLWRAPERFDPSRGTLRSFLLAVAHGRAVDVLRSDTAPPGPGGPRGVPDGGSSSLRTS